MMAGLMGRRVCGVMLDDMSFWEVALVALHLFVWRGSGLRWLVKSTGRLVRSAKKTPTGTGLDTALGWAGLDTGTRKVTRREAISSGIRMIAAWSCSWIPASQLGKDACTNVVTI